MTKEKFVFKIISTGNVLVYKMTARYNFKAIFLVYELKLLFQNMPQNKLHG